MNKDDSFRSWHARCRSLHNAWPKLQLSLGNSVGFMSQNILSSEIYSRTVFIIHHELGNEGSKEAHRDWQPFCNCSEAKKRDTKPICAGLRETGVSQMDQLENAKRSEKETHCVGIFSVPIKYA